MDVRGLSKPCVAWWKAEAKDWGFEYQGRARLRQFFDSIFKGEIRLVSEDDYRKIYPHDE